MVYTKETWTNGSGNAIDAASLTHLETQYDEAMAETLTRDIQKSIVDVKGDLIVATSDNTVSRVAVGSNGQVLIADSSQAAGVRWGAGGGGASAVPFITPNVNDLFGPVVRATNASGVENTGTSSQQTAGWIFLGSQITVDQATIEVTTLQVGTSVKFLLYDSDSDGYPRNLVLNSGALSCDTTGFKSATVTPVVLPAGIYHGFIRSNAPDNTPRFRSYHPNPLMYLAGASSSGPQVKSAVAANVGSYASPTTPLVSFTELPNYDDWVGPPWFLLRRSA